MQDKSNHPVHISQCMTKPTKSCSEPENSINGGPEVVFSYQHISPGCMDLPREAIGPKRFNCFSREVHTRIFKETYSYL